MGHRGESRGTRPETGQILRETEDLVCAAGGCNARLAGIYGPGRSVLLKKFFTGEATIEGDGSRWINQIHRDDIAAALALLVGQRAAGIFNVADDTPLTQRDIIPGSHPVSTDRSRRSARSTRIASAGSPANA